MMGGGQSERDFDEIGEINVTPFIDVMLVLLIIFMVAAPLATVNVPLDLPISKAEPAEPPPDPIVLSIQSDLSWSVGDQSISHDELESVLLTRTSNDFNARIF